MRRNFPIHTVEVNSTRAVVRLASVLDLRIRRKASLLAAIAEEQRDRQGKKAGGSEMHGYDPSVALDRIVAVEEVGMRPTYGVSVEPSHLLIAHGLVMGDCSA